MSTEDKYWFSAAEIAALANAGAAKMPATERGALRHAKENHWESKVVPGKGGKGGMKTVFMPPDHLLKKIFLFMLNNPYFLDTGEIGIPKNDYEEHAINLNARKSYGDFVFVPRYDVKASAGHGSLIHSEQIVDHLAFKKSWVRLELGCAEKDLALITVKGDSMEPTLSPNDLILIDLRKNYVADNAVYVLQYDGSLLVKRIQRLMNGSVIIKSDNPEYKIEELSADQAKKLNVLGVVVWYGRKM